LNPRPPHCQCDALPLRYEPTVLSSMIHLMRTLPIIKHRPAEGKM